MRPNRMPNNHRELSMVEAATAFRIKHPEMTDFIVGMVCRIVQSHIKNWQKGVHPKQWDRFSSARLTNHSLIHDWVDYLQTEQDVYGYVAFIQDTVDRTNAAIKQQYRRAVVPYITLRNMKDALIGAVMAKVFKRARVNCGAKNAQVIYDIVIGTAIERSRRSGTQANSDWLDLVGVPDRPGKPGRPGDLKYYAVLATRKQIDVALKGLQHAKLLSNENAQRLLLGNSVADTWRELKERGLLEAAAESYRNRKLPRKHANITAMLTQDSESMHLQL